MCRLTQNSWAKGKNHNQFKVRPWGFLRSNLGAYLALNSTHKKKARMAKLKNSGLTSVRWIKIKIESKKEMAKGQNLACFLAIESKRRKARRIKKVLTKINPAKPVKLKMPKKITSLSQW